MKYQAIIGVDVSKEWLDLCLLIQGDLVWRGRVKNDSTSIRKLLTELRQSFKLTLSQTLIVLESTGIYGMHLLEVAWGRKMPVWMEHAMHIKAANGMTRGKSDVIDAERIALYGLRYQDKIRLWTPPRDVLRQLKALSVTRQRMIRARKMLSQPIKEMKAFSGLKESKMVQTCSDPVISQLTKQIRMIDDQIKDLIQKDDHLSRQVNRITSIKGVGMVTAVAMVIETEEFTKYADAKKLACAAGVVPFAHSSGRYKGKERVSHKANKRLKTLLHQCARSAVGVPGELREYYDRKVAEGKHKMSVLNAVRNKIVLRIFAVIRDDVMYNPKFQYALA